MEKDAHLKEEFFKSSILHPFKVESANPLKVNMSESSIEIDDHAAHLNQSPVQSGIYSSKQALDDIKPDKWNNIPYPLVDCIKLILKDLKNRDKKFHEHSLIYDEFVAKTEFQRNRMVTYLTTFISYFKIRKKMLRGEMINMKQS